LVAFLAVAAKEEYVREGMNAAAISTASTTLRSALELFVLVMLYLHKIKMRNSMEVEGYGNCVERLYGNLEVNSISDKS
jgi:hypothetical protein